MLGAIALAAVYVSPIVLMPLLPERLVNGVAFSYGMAGPAVGFGLLGLPLIIGICRWMEGD